MLNSDGYVKVRVGRTHPMADANGYVYEHDLVAVAALGRPLAPGQIVHHENEDKADNRWENLIVETRGEHNAEHNARRGREENGRFRGAS
jgi:hypothetical protein